MGKVELVEVTEMQQNKDGSLVKLTRKTVAFCSQNIKDMEVTIKGQYPTFDYPVGNVLYEKQTFSIPTTYWTWGYYRMTNGIRTMSMAMQEHEETLLFCFSQNEGPPQITWDGAMKSARKVFKLLENNPDITLFVHYNETTMEKL